MLFVFFADARPVRGVALVVEADGLPVSIIEHILGCSVLADGLLVEVAFTHRVVVQFVYQPKTA